MHRSMLLVAALALSACQPLVEGADPRVDTVEPRFLCHAQHESTLTVRGDGFTPQVTDALSHTPELSVPALELTMESDLFGRTAAGLTLPVPEDDLLWVSETELEVTLTPDLEWLDGVYGITVTNPDGQDAHVGRAVIAAPPPTLSETNPPFACIAQQDTSIQVKGGAFLMLPDANPTVTIGDWVAPRVEPSDCAVIIGPVTAHHCATLTVTLPQETLDLGASAITVTNPAPAECHTTEPLDLFVVAPPSLARIEPLRLCNAAGDTDLTLFGGDFLFFGKQAPVVTIDDETAPVIEGDGCSDVAGLEGAQACTSMTVLASVGDLPGGEHLVKVTNPEPAACETGVLTFTVDRLPTLTSIDPDHVCETGGSFTLYGAELSEEMTIHLDDLEVAFEYTDEAMVDVTVPPGVEPGKHEVEVVQGTCQAILKKTLEVLAVPVVHSVDPSIVATPEDVEITLAVSGITGTLTRVWLVSVKDASETELSFTWDAKTPDVAVAVVPAGLPDGLYDVYVELDDNCPGFLPAGLEVRS
ncbi:MAG: hypothetical protein JXB39_00075 [Deltaproteobacteria bacterium]|nr:hypothetical protein [Deltaproteobacteria bacterium]